MNKRSAFLIAALLAASRLAVAQFGDRDSIDMFLKSSHTFAIYKDNYVLTGVPLNEKTTNRNADIKIQLSFTHRLTDAILPYKTYLFVTYTQISFWSVYRSSGPFSESNYNPAIGLGKVIYGNGSFKGILSAEFEHQSNGRDSIFSRGWNRITVAGSAPLSARASLSLYVWFPFDYEHDNPDLIRYTGYGEASFDWTSHNERFVFDITARKGARRDFTGSLQTQINFRLTKKANQYLSLQWFTGYMEDLINYNRMTSMIRLGFVIKPSRFVN